ncbi:MAG TPA: IclR family transcriptional regulator [Geobacteraceae bacterium]
MTRKDKNDYLIQSVSLALTLLEQFRSGAHELRVTDLSRLLRVSKNNVFRLLATLEARNFVERGSAGGYRLGLTALNLSEACIRSKQLVKEARQSLEDVSHQSRETVFLAVPGGAGLVCEEAIVSPLPVRVLAPAGTCLPFRSTAAGKVMVACGEFDRGEDAGAGSGGALDLGELQEIRAKGYAISVGEFEAGASGVAAPVRNHSSRVIGVIGLVGPSFRLTHERLDGELASLVLRAAGDVSQRMGYRAPVERELLVQSMHAGNDVVSRYLIRKAGTLPPRQQGRRAAV